MHPLAFQRICLIPHHPGRLCERMRPGPPNRPAMLLRSHFQYGIILYREDVALNMSQHLRRAQRRRVINRTRCPFDDRRQRLDSLAQRRKELAREIWTAGVGGFSA